MLKTKAVFIYNVSLFIICCMLLSSCTVPGMRMSDNDDFTPSVNQNGKAEKAKLIKIQASLILKQAKDKQNLKQSLAENYVKPNGLTTETDSYRYRIGFQDIINIIVWNEDSIANPITNLVIASNVKSNGFTVDADGYIYYPYVGYIKVIGMTVAKARDLIAEKLKEYMKNPQITLKIIEFNSQKINITGAVRNPKAIPITNVPISILEAINNAGGPIRCGNALRNATGNSSGNNQQICADTKGVIVKQGGLETIVNIDALKAADGSSTNWILEKGSIIFIPTNRYLVYVLGDVLQPGAFNMINGQMTLKDAIVAARGVTAGSDSAYTYVIRNYKQNPQVFIINLKSPDALILAGQFDLVAQDIIFVSQSTLQAVGQVLGYVAPLTSLGIATASLGVSLSAVSR